MKTIFCIFCLTIILSTAAQALDGNTPDGGATARIRAEQDAAKVAKKLDADREEVQDELDESIVWMKIAARHGNEDAIFLLGYSYATGIGVRQNYEEAEFWLTLAALRAGKSEKKSADPIATRLTEIEKHLTPVQIATIKNRARNWQPEPLPGDNR